MNWKRIVQSTQHSPLASEHTYADSHAFIYIYTYATHMYHAHIHTHRVCYPQRKYPSHLSQRAQSGLV